MRLSEAAGVLFDLDGVLTDTAEVHARAWSLLFTEFLDSHGSAGQPVQSYTDADYFAHIDGKPRYEAVRVVLASRGIDLPDGDITDSPRHLTVCGLGNRKNDLALAILRDEGVRVFPGSGALLDLLEERRIPTAIVSSSRNAHAVLAAAGLRERFETVVDGVAAASAGLAGKPAPDTYRHAAALLGLTSQNTVVVEDAISGVQAGRAGGFFVVGVDRGAGRSELLQHGADIVVDDLADLTEGFARQGG